MAKRQKKVRAGQRPNDHTLLQTNMEAPTTLLEDLVPFNEKLPCLSEGVYPDWNGTQKTFRY